MIAFLAPNMASQFAGVHPELRALLERFDAWAVAKGLPPTTLTEVWRTPEDQVRIYVPYWQKLQSVLTAGGQLSLSDRRQAVAVQNISEPGLRDLAVRKPSNHLWRCAVDVRTRHYSPAELTEVEAWWRDTVSAGGHMLPQYEWLLHDVAGPHMHIGRRDAEWQKRFDPRPPSNGAPHAA